MRRAAPYLPTGSRPDGTGKRFFTFRGHFGIATETTPIYERYFAGNFGSLRGFQYRTVSPHVFDVPTGGVMMAIGSVEYQIPWNARDTIHQIFFTDFGTVTGNYEFTDMRVSVGTGLKVVLADRSHAVRVRPGISRSQSCGGSSRLLQFRGRRSLVNCLSLETTFETDAIREMSQAHFLVMPSTEHRVT